MDFTVAHPHWIILCLFLFFLPRTTLVFMLLLTSLTTPDGGYFLLFWLGWLICPRFVIAVLALPYFATNPVLVVGAWVLAFAGESAEKKTLAGSGSKRRDSK